MNRPPLFSSPDPGNPVDESKSPTLETALRALLTSYGFDPTIERDGSDYQIKAHTKAYRVAVLVTDTHYLTEPKREAA